MINNTNRNKNLYLDNDRAPIVVFKIELDTLYDNEGVPSAYKIDKLCMLCADMKNSGVKILLVSSGAIALGTALLRLKQYPATVTMKQAVSAVGQAELIIIYQDHFDHYNQNVAQVLLTKDVIDNPVRNLNAKNTLNRLLQQQIIPVINENDSVSTNDIIMNDNYPLVKIVASLVEADAVVVNMHEEDKYMLLVRNHSCVIDAGNDKLLDLTAGGSGKIYEADNKISGFPDLFECAG